MWDASESESESESALMVVFGHVTAWHVNYTNIKCIKIYKWKEKFIRLT